MNPNQVRCLILGCGSTLRGDDGIGPALCAWAEERFAAEPGVRVIARHQWTPDLAVDVAEAAAVVFIDCSIETEPGQILLREIAPAPAAGIATHYVGASDLLALARDLYRTTPRDTMLLTVGASSIELGEVFSDPVQAVLADARRQLETAVLGMLRAL